MLSQTKEEILKLLFQHKETFISGQAICEQLGCSRTAVWKHITELRKEGYTIESVQKRGYKLLEAPKRLTKEEVLANLNSRYFGKVIDFHEVVPSTQKIAHHLAEDGATHGTLVLADEQAGGRGRLGRVWHSPKGTGIWMSLILKPDLTINRIPQLTLLAAVAIVRSIKKVSDVDCSIKWPNDILFEGKKLVGILTELQSEMENVRAVIIGMGINVNIEWADMPAEIRDIATSLKIITGKTQSRVMLIQTIMTELEKLYDLYLNEGFEVIKPMWETYALSIGKVIRARTMQGEVLQGVAKGINNDGVLLLEDDQGVVHHIYSADIEI
ncbi:biotin--[acetyl-CoA-carboxylase] ligase [Pullulanibacillus pueri]|uniref:biotin--[acetyl-CoA-carboxylase] ligase n=1 Tax=Pullulanibacillus pueri TaxID=1437324 RepID=UPI00166DA843|nr:biotin--[acetyl-CoA-carboxylase] ligase [Pullulanibacillus pueri]